MQEPVSLKADLDSSIPSKKFMCVLVVAVGEISDGLIISSELHTTNHVLFALPNCTIKERSAEGTFASNYFP